MDLFLGVITGNPQSIRFLVFPSLAISLIINSFSDIRQKILRKYDFHVSHSTSGMKDHENACIPATQWCLDDEEGSIPQWSIEGGVLLRLLDKMRRECQLQRGCVTEINPATPHACQCWWRKLRSMGGQSHGWKKNGSHSASYKNVTRTYKD